MKLPYKIGCKSQFPNGFIINMKQEVYSIISADALQAKHPEKGWKTEI